MLRPFLTWACVLTLTGCSKPAEPRVNDSVSTGTSTSSVDTNAVGMDRVAVLSQHTCANPSAREVRPFVLYDEGDWSSRLDTGSGWGITVADLNSDGWLDLLVPNREGPRHYQGSPNGFTDVSDNTLSPDFAASRDLRATSAADYDDDGDLDVYVGGSGESFLLENVGSGVLRVDTDSGMVSGKTLGASWGDLDGDGDLDFVVSNGSSTEDPGIYENRDGTFVASPGWVEPTFFEGHTFQVGVADLDGDMLPEIYRVNDIAGRHGNLLLWNKGGGTFVPDGGASGLDVDICSMGLGVGDVNGDEIQDLAISDCDDLWLFESVGGLWADTSAMRSLRTLPEEDLEVPWGMEIADMDNDGDQDLYTGYGFLSADNWPMAENQPDAIYLMGEDGSFTEVGRDWGITDTGRTRGVTLADLNNDGWLDVVKHSLNDGKPFLYMSNCGEEGWLRVELRQPAPNTHAIGAKVRFSSGDWSVVRWMRAGGTSIGGGGPNEIHVGLGMLDDIFVDVIWPDGQETRHGPIAPRQRVQIVR